MDAHREAVSDREASKDAKPEPAPRAEAPAAGRAAAILGIQRAAGNQAVCALLDALTEDGDGAADETYLDAARELRVARDPPDGGTAAPPAPAGSGSGRAGGTPAPPAIPNNLNQIVTSWAPGATKYGFQLKFQCGSSSGSVADLQSQPNLKWREYVTYSRNDFAHRIAPSNPTILPPGGGIGFTAATTTVVGPNVLEFNTARDTHWMPTSAVRDSDFVPTGTRALPAIMESSQLYQFSTDGSTWTNFAGPFSLTRTLAPEVGPPLPGQTMPLLFTTNKAGINSVTETYKP